VVALLAACASGGTSGRALDPDLEAGREVFGRVCASCHGGNGEGGAGPALASVLETFRDCEDHIRWVTSGSERHKDEVGPTFGDTDKEITGIMPSFESVLTATEIAQVAAFERHRFGGADPEVARANCGL
jgi:mono/diheme cytochrome c family protein